MASVLNDTSKNLMLDALAAVAVFVSAHDDDPGTDGSNELAGGSYIRKAITWNAAATHVVTASNTPALPIPASSTVAYIGLRSAESAGTYYGHADVTDEVFTGAGTYTVTSYTITATDA